MINKHLFLHYLQSSLVCISIILSVALLLVLIVKHYHVANRTRTKHKGTEIQEY